MAWQKAGGVSLAGDEEIKLHFVDEKLAIDEHAARRVSRQLATKGFCVVSMALPSNLESGALSDVRDLDARGLFSSTSPLLADGLLGLEGSSHMSVLDDKIYMAGSECRFSLEVLIKAVADLAQFAAPDLEVDARTLVHQSGEVPDKEVTELSTGEAWNWLGTFLRCKLSVVCFLGPARGALELRPYQKESAEPFRLRTGAGMAVLFRPDLLACAHYADGCSFAISRFSLAAAMRPGRTAGATVTPVALELDALITDALHRQASTASGEKDSDDNFDTQVLPLEWQRSLRMSATNSSGNSMVVRSAALRLPCAEELATWSSCSAAGPDWVSEVPNLRWDHSEVYDPMDDGWVENKVYCNHASFIDGLHLFDCRAFGLTVQDAAAMDPHQRMSLETGYSALFRTGQRRSTLRGSDCSVYVGCGSTEWMLMHESTKAHPTSVGGGAGQGACASRLSTQLGLKGQSLVLDAEGASGLAALHLASESLLRTSVTGWRSNALAVGVHLCLSPVWWPSACASGLLSRKGRCLSFDESADGYVRGEGCCAIVLGKDDVALDAESKLDSPPLGCLTGSSMASSGQHSGLLAPRGSSDPGVLAEALGRSGVAPADVDCIQADGSGSLLADALEAANLTRTYRAGGASREALVVSSAKTSCGHQMACAGLTSFLEALLGANLGGMAPKLHLHTLSPHVDLSRSPMAFVSEAVELRDPSPYIGVSSLGFSGYSVHAVAWGQSPAKMGPEALPIEKAIVFWPGGGGELRRSMRPMRAYTIVGTWSKWAYPAKMEFEGAGTYVYTITLGDSCCEEFRILLDGDKDRVLHPGVCKAATDTAVFGPTTSDDVVGSWLIDGAAEVDIAGAPGDRYRIQLQIAGQWRMVAWQREEPALPELCAP